MEENLRTTFLYHLLASFPLLAFAVAFLLTKLTHINRISLPWKSLTVCLVALLIVSAVAYLFLPIIFDDAESGVAGASIQAMRGQPIYPSPSAAARYGLVYGPIASLWHVPFYYVFGKNLVAFKLAGVLVFFLSLIGIYRICRSYVDPGSALLGLGCASVLLFQYLGYDFWGRTDPLILFLVVASILVTTNGPGWAVVLTVALTVGLVPNLKVSGIAYLLPVLTFAVIRRGWKISSIAAGCGVVVIALPFLLPQVSLANYVFLINVFKNQGLSIDFLSRNIQYTLILLIPIVFLIRSGNHELRPRFSPQLIYLVSIASGMAVTCLLGSKLGAGNYHLLPYLAPTLHLYFWERSELPSEARALAGSRFAIPFVATLMFYSTTHVISYVSLYIFQKHGAVIASEIRQVEQTWPGRSVEVGVGDVSDDPRISYGPLAAFDGQPYTMNFQSVRDTQLGGVALPEATINEIRTCGIDIWLIPKAQAPFAASNSYYKSSHPAFSESFQNAFLQHYRKVESLNEFDVWICATDKK